MQQRFNRMLLALGLIAASPLALSAEPVLRVATDGTFPPYSMVSADGRLSGFDVEIANALCAQMKVKCEINRYDFEGMIAGLNTKKFDMIVASMAITPERQKAVSFSDKYEGGYSQFFAARTNKLNPSPAGMKGKRIGVQLGSIQEHYAKDTFGKAGATVRSYNSSETAFLDLAANRLDAIMIEVGVGYELKKHPKGKNFDLVGPKFNDPAYFGTGSGIAVRKDDKALLSKVNTALATILKNGSYKKINDRYFNYDQYE